jgi:hypothetical protein
LCGNLSINDIFVFQVSCVTKDSEECYRLHHRSTRRFSSDSWMAFSSI